MLTIQNIDKIINQRIVLSVVRIDMRGTYYILNTWKWSQQGNEQYHFHLRHVNKLHNDIKIVLNRFKTDTGYILWNEDKPKNDMLLSTATINNMQMFLRAIETVMIMN